MISFRTMLFIVCLAASGLVVVITAGGVASPVRSSAWNARAAATYLDQRQLWWESWSRARRDHGTVCVSCHTALPYALVRPELRLSLHETGPTAAEQKLLSDVTNRVRAWRDVKPYYGGDSTQEARQKAIQSRATEAVLNAVILASQDQRTGVVSAEARTAFANMFALQQTTGAVAGAWPWLNFGLRPWETTDAAYFGAALAAIALGREPGGYAATAEIKSNVDRLSEYLRTHVDQPLWKRVLRRDDPDLFNRAMLLWASARLPGLISNQERHSIVVALWNAQAADGGWRLASLGRWRALPSNDALDAPGDGYATGLIAYALEEVGTLPTEPHLARALDWLVLHQEPESGVWRASSLNEQRDPRSNVGKFMSDAATAYAALALTRADRQPTSCASCAY